MTQDRANLEAQIDAEVKRLEYISWFMEWVTPCKGEQWHRVTVVQNEKHDWLLGKEGTEEESLADALRFLKGLVNRNNEKEDEYEAIKKDLY
jgi:hypothetical protein